MVLLLNPNIVVIKPKISHSEGSAALVMGLFRKQTEASIRKSQRPSIVSLFIYIIYIIIHLKSAP
jgi:hypothetical protein